MGNVPQNAVFDDSTKEFIVPFRMTIKEYGQYSEHSILPERYKLTLTLLTYIEYYIKKNVIA